MDKDIFPKLVERYAAEHFRQKSDRNSFYSISKNSSGNLGGKNFTSMIDDALCLAGDDDMSADEGLGGSPAIRATPPVVDGVEHIWFRPMMLRPSWKKSVRSDIPLPFSSTDMAVTTHGVMHYDEAAKEVLVSLTSASAGPDPEIALLEPASWIELREWQKKRITLHIVLGGRWRLVSACPQHHRTGVLCRGL